MHDRPECSHLIWGSRGSLRSVESVLPARICE